MEAEEKTVPWVELEGGLPSWNGWGEERRHSEGQQPNKKRNEDLHRDDFEGQT